LINQTPTVVRSLACEAGVLDYQQVYDTLRPFFLRRRMARFVSVFNPDRTTEILDVGGEALTWTLCNSESDVTLLNLSLPADTSTSPRNLRFVMGDATRLNFPDRSFEIAYSNSVIEHLHTFENQLKFADEIRRVGRNVWVQTPARWFFIEPHYLGLFIHYFPKEWQRRLIRYATGWGLLRHPRQEEVDNYVNELRLLSLKEMRLLFPDCKILKERFLFLAKAYVAVRRDPERRDKYRTKSGS
jgi:hypothetical protein